MYSMQQTCARLSIRHSSNSSISTISSSLAFSTRTTKHTTANDDQELPKVPAPSVTLYQYAICPFCNINKSLLSYSNVPYRKVEVNPLTKTEIKPWSKDNYTKVPIALVDDEQYNGSDEINMVLLGHQYVKDELKKKWDQNGKDIIMSMDKFQSSSEAEEWTTFAKDELAPILYPNICRSLSESYHAFGYVHSIDNFSMVQKYMIRSIGSFAMYMAASRIKSKRNIVDERKALQDALTKWEEEGLDSGSKVFSSGLAVPNLGDVAMFGVLNSVSGFVDEKKVVNGRVGVISEWYNRMKDEIVHNETTE